MRQASLLIIRNCKLPEKMAISIKMYWILWREEELSNRGSNH